MKLLEIKNNLVKLSYADTETPVLGRFIVLSTQEKSYVAQFVNLKSDSIHSFAIAKLLFTFTSDGVVDNYDGSIPSITSEVSFLPAEELLNLLPVETPIKFGNLSQLEDMLSLDVSIFERNLTVFAQKNSHKTTFISNCIRQLFQMKEKSVIIETDNLFEDYDKIVFTKDFKLPLNSKMIDYIFEYELDEVDPATKAVIQDIFYAVQQYVKTLDFEFLPIDNFVDVVTNQYKDMQMPELALLKNKLLKYRDANIFANTKEEVLALKEHLNEKNCSIIDISSIHDSLQREVISFIHMTLESFEKYIYLFLPLNDDNSDKKLLKQVVNNNHIFTTLLVANSYKYANELKQYAQNMFLFAPDDMNHDFAAYNTFLSKLNPDECIAFGKLTQGIPFIIDMNDLELDLTRDDVLGDKYQFIPAYEDDMQLVKVDQFGTKIPVNFEKKEEQTDVEENVEESETVEEPSMQVGIPEIQQPSIELVDEPEEEMEEVEEEVLTQEVEENRQSVIKPLTNLLAPEEPIDAVDEVFENEDLDVSDLDNEEDLTDFQDLSEDDLDENNYTEQVAQDNLTEDDLNFIDENQLVKDSAFDALFSQQHEEESYVEDMPFAQEQAPAVPVFPVEDDEPEEEDECGFKQGDQVTHPRYGRGVVGKIIKYGNKTFCSVSFENVGRRLIDTSISEISKI